MRTKGHVPGEAGVWVLILGDLLVFAAFFLTFLDYRGREVVVFVQSQAALNRDLGLINTALLLTSSLLVAVAVHRARDGRRFAPLLFAGALVCGLGFVAVKVVEYGEKFTAGIGFTTNSFFMLYFAFTGIHLFHVLLGLGVLAYLAVASRPAGAAAGRMIAIESGASFWHMVDLLWIILFALIYLLR